MYQGFKETALTAEHYYSKIYYRKTSMIDNKQLFEVNPQEYVNNKFRMDDKGVSEVAKRHIHLLEDIQLRKLDNLGTLEYSIMLQRAYASIDRFLSRDGVHSEYSNATPEEVRLEHALEAVFALSKIGRLDIISRLTDIKDYRDKVEEDQQAFSMLCDLKPLVKGIEHYQCGRWWTAISYFLEFARENYKALKISRWMRIVERTWYIAIMLTCDRENGVYLPINALNLIAPEVVAQEQAQNYDENFIYINEYHTEKDIQVKSENLSTVKKQLEIFTSLLKHILEVQDYCGNEKQTDMRKILIASFNMIGTLAANCSDISLVPHETVAEFIDVYSSSALMQNENTDKFAEYF